MGDLDQGSTREAVTRTALRALVRWALVAAAALPWAVAIGAGREGLVLAALLGGLALPGAALEERARPAGRLVLVAGAALTLALAVLVVAQAAYTAGLFAGGFDAGYRAVEDALVDPGALAGKAAVLGGGFAAALVYRLRYLRLGEQLSGLLLAEGGGLALLLAALFAVARALAPASVQECALLCLAFVALSVTTGGVLVALFHVGDVVAPRRRA
ncbi:MAG: hypothetical protein KF878_24860 [Planctomycetes bacterium]|nr:hypothetical protein [Planctomycetota bacterium]